MGKFPGQALSVHHSSDRSHSSDNTESLTTRLPGNSFFFFSLKGVIAKCLGGVQDTLAQNFLFGVIERTGRELE